MGAVTSGTLARGVDHHPSSIVAKLSNARGQATWRLDVPGGGRYAYDAGHLSGLPTSTHLVVLAGRRAGHLAMSTVAHCVRSMHTQYL